MLQHMINNTNDELIDWDAVWASLYWDDPARREEIVRQRLRQRAQQYATPIEDTRLAGDTSTVLTFYLGDETYSVDVMLVQSIRPLGNVTRVPGAPSFYRGVVNVRGQIISVLDLRLFFDMAVNETSLLGELVIVQVNQLRIGLLADHVAEIVTLPDSTIEPLEDVRYARGITAERLIVLNIRQLFEDERLIIGGVED